MIWILLAATSIVSLGGYVGWRRSQSRGSLLLEAQRTISETKEVLKKFESLTDEEYAQAVTGQAGRQAKELEPPAQRVLREMENHRNAYRVLLEKRDQVRAYEYASPSVAWMIQEYPDSVLTGLVRKHAVEWPQSIGEKRRPRREAERTPKANKKGHTTIREEANAW